MNAIIKNQQEIIETLRARLAELEKQDPVCWMTPSGEGWMMRTEPPVTDTKLGWTAMFAAPVVSSDVEKLKSEIADLQVFCDRLYDRRNSLVGENQSLKNEAAFWKQETKTWADKHDELAESFQGHPNKPVIERLKTELEAARADAERYRWLKGQHQNVPNTTMHVRNFLASPIGYDLDVAIDQAKGGV